MSAGGSSERAELFFIIGSPRSGTTLLQSVCMSAEGVYVPPETHFLTRFPRSRGLKSPAEWERALREIEEVSSREELPLRGLREAERLAERSQAGLLRLWLESCARAEGARWVGEASNVHTRDVLKLAALFPEAKIVHMIRDPRDVATSQREAWGTPVTRAALRWRDEMRAHERALSALSPARYRAIHYERLVTEPRAEISALCAWFGWPFSAQMLSPHQRAQRGFAARESHKLRTLQPITATRVGRWREELSEEESHKIELICGAQLARRGYQREARSFQRSARLALPLARELTEIGVSYAQRLFKRELDSVTERVHRLQAERAEEREP